MLADDHACDPRNVFPGEMYDHPEAWRSRGGGEDGDRNGNLYTEDIEIDFRGLDCSVENLLSVLTGRYRRGWTEAGEGEGFRWTGQRRLDTDSSSRLLIYLTGHGGEGFLKFHDQQELTASDLGDALLQMWLQGRYGEALILVDTCQASTLNTELRSPGVIAAGSSGLGENSYSRDTDFQLGLSLVDRFTFAVNRWVDERIAAAAAAVAREGSQQYSGGKRVRGRARDDDDDDSVAALVSRIVRLP